MKRLIIAAGVTGMILTGCGNIDESDVPSVVVNSVKSKYPQQEKIVWEKWENGFEAEFNLGKVATTVYVDSAGSILLQEQELHKESLPATIATVISNQYKDYQLEEVERLEKDNQVYYHVELDRKGSGKDLELTFTADGRPATAISSLK